MRLMFCGDVVGRSGRKAVQEHLPRLRRELALDFVVVNGENAASGFGITEKICRDLFEAGADVISGGNHSWDRLEIAGYMNTEPRVLRPMNYPEGTPGRGLVVHALADGRKVLVANVMGRLYMDPLDDPFAAVRKALEHHRLGGTIDAAIVDIHAEATSEKMAMGHYLDGRVSLVVGTHTHVPTADYMVLPGGTAYQTDAGMCGDYDSVIGMDKQAPLARFVRKISSERLSAAQGEGTLCAVFVETDDRTGLARRIEPVRVGGRLRQVVPALREVVAE